MTLGAPADEAYSELVGYDLDPPRGPMENAARHSGGRAIDGGRDASSLIALPPRCAAAVSRTLGVRPLRGADRLPARAYIGSAV